MRKGWEYKKLGEVGTFLRGKNILKSDFVEKGLPCIHYGQIHTKFGISTDTHLTETSQEVYNKAIIASKNDVLIAITSEDLEGSCKATAWLGDYDVAVSAHAAVFKHNLNPKYIVYYLKSQSFYIEKSKYARGFKVMEIKPTDIAKIPIPIPPKSTQLAIVSELDKINELIRLKKEQLKDFDNLAQNLFYEMFGDPVENEKGWEVKKLNEIVSDNCSISYGIVQPGDGIENGVPVVRPVDMTGTFVYRQGLKNTTKEISDSYKRTILKGNEILMCVRGTTGLIAMASSELRGCNVTRGITPIECGKSCNKWFIYYQISNSSIQQYIAEYTRGIALKQINMKDVRDIPLCLPPLPLQHLFAHRIEQIEHQKAEVQKSITDLETLLASRMQYWFE